MREVVVLAAEGGGGGALDDAAWRVAAVLDDGRLAVAPADLEQ